MIRVASDPDALRVRVNAYAAWVAKLRRGRSLPNLRLDGADPLSRLGQELQLLADTLVDENVSFDSFSIWLGRSSRVSWSTMS